MCSTLTNSEQQLKEEEEYTDYSCSTAIERLSRDIESLLRSWHIHNGCDRHFSVSTNPDGLTLLRAERLTWVATLPPDRQPVRVELELALWDGPATVVPVQNQKKKQQKKRASVTLEASKKIRLAMKKTNRRGSLSNDECHGAFVADRIVEEEKEEEEEGCNHLPKALQRQGAGMPNGSLFDNFSTLFGIGQHLTLTPTNPLMDLGLDDQDGSGCASPTSLTQRFLGALLQRHSPTNSKWALTQLLANWLQTALNCATMNCHCCIPAFGLWGNYPSASLPSEDDLLGPDIDGGSSCSDGQPSTTIMAQHEVNIYPAWLEAARSLRLPTVIAPPPIANSTKRGIKSSKHHRKKKGKKRKTLKEFLERDREQQQRSLEEDPAMYQSIRYLPPCVAGSVLPVQDDIHANFTCSVLPVPLKHDDDGGDANNNLRLSYWGEVFMNRCPDSVNVVLSGARHVYSWQKANDLNANNWRGEDPKDYWKRKDLIMALNSSGDARPPEEQEVERYKLQCRAYALELLEQSISDIPGQNVWGPIHDPIAAIHAKVSWTSGSRNGQPLLSFPYHSTGASSELSLEQSILDPYQTPSKFQIQTFLDHQSLEPTLATTQRCVLACLIRTATLAPLTLLRHLLWEEDIIEDWDHDAGNAAALHLANEARVGDATQTLVDVMDWRTCAEEMISLEEAEAIVEEALEGYTHFPAPPDGFAGVNLQKDPLLAPLFQSAPLGRLVSELLVRMARLRAPCSMALVWSTFCNELRQRWDAREPLPHMKYVPGLDPSPQALKERRQVSTIGLKAELAAIWGSTEPDPDGQHCIIGQKLQLFNIGVETATTIEAQTQHQNGSVSSDDGETSWPHDYEEGNVGTEAGSSTPMPKRAASIVSLSSEMPGLPLSTTAKGSEGSGERIVDLSSLATSQIPKELFGTSSGQDHATMDDPTQTALTGEGGDDDVDDHDHVSASSDSVSSAEFFDAQECGLSVFSDPSTLFAHNLVTSVVHRIDRKGARCPVHGCSLVASGDQLFAPYLLRPQPLTDDLILERRSMLSDQRFDSEVNNQDERMPVQRRLEIAYRLQKPKLLSDMSAFKAANPGAVFQDFVNWYGNPGNPLDDYNASSSSVGTDGLASSQPNALKLKLDKAAEAIHILNETRNFWSSTWDEAPPVPASEQKALFDVYSTVEMAIDYLENLHPAILLNQILAVNFANVYFMLVASAKDATKIDVVEKSLLRLRKQTEEALELLADEAANATCSFYHYTELEDSVSNFVSVEAISACEAVCVTLSEAEVMVSLATSLLQKFPRQYDFVQTILKESDGGTIDLPDLRGRACILDSIFRQQQQRDSRSDGVTGSASPIPVLREYLLRNVDDSTPCQLSVRYGDTNASCGGVPSKDSASLMVALTKTQAY